MSDLDEQIGIQWIEIPAGEFIYGLGRASEIRSIDENYLIARTPITYSQYKIFLDANLEMAVPKDWNVESRTFKDRFANHPVVYILYHQAEIFCQWLGCRLPSEEEWEKAARGDNGNIYPWGDQIKSPSKDYVNFNQKSIKKFGTTPVDSHPKGASPYGVLEMAGNVYEWTSGWYNDKNKIMRVGRGGYWGNSKHYITTTYRKNLHPQFESPAIGFRPVKTTYK